MIRAAILAFSIAFEMLPRPAQAQEYPSRTIRLIVPSTAAGTSDVLARMLAPKVGESLAQQVVVDNRPDASTTIGVGLVAKAAPDGYTIGITPAALAINPSMFKKLPYDALRDVSPVSRLVEGPSLLMSHPSVPARNIKELIALAKAKPGSLNVASSGIGTIPHLAAELFQLMATVKTPQIVYKGSGQGMISVISGELALMYASPISVMSLLKAGKLRPLGVSSAARSNALPDVQTIAETLPGYEATQWFGIIAPPGTPKPIVDRLSQQFSAALRAPEMNQRLTADGLDVIASSPEQFAQQIKTDMDKWAKVIKAAGIRAEE
jgi:tripartite-type tricarboxylate transporter receptor subunit TctC